MKERGSSERNVYEANLAQETKDYNPGMCKVILKEKYLLNKQKANNSRESMNSVHAKNYMIYKTIMAIQVPQIRIVYHHPSASNKGRGTKHVDVNVWSKYRKYSNPIF